MKTDELFYELFKVDPRSLFRLVQLEVEGEYTFESLTIKTTEKRLDGFCQRIDGTGPNVFVEIQGYDDPKIYWRALREVCTYYEQNDATVPFVLIVLFLDTEFDPGDFPLSAVKPPHHFIRGTLSECFEKLQGAPGILTVLKPLVTERQEIVKHVQQWKAEIQALLLSEETLHRVIELLEFAIRQRLPKLSEQEVQTMLHLTPLEETVAGQELIQIGKQEGRKEGRKEGINKGELIGEIRVTQKFLKRPVTPVEDLARKSLKTLKVMLQELEADLAKLN
jgi:predicted transposase YdaD